MRGKEENEMSKQFYARITPAHAGKSRSARAAAAGRKDHPRACGEK